MRKFNINEYYNGEDLKIYNKNSIELHPGTTLLLGCNGAGKSTLIHQIKDHLHAENKESEDKLILAYDEVREGRSNALSKFGFLNDYDKLTKGLFSSEGENVSNNFGYFVQSLGSRMSKLDDKIKEVWIFLDGIDSGLSIDMIKNNVDFFPFLMDQLDKEGITYYIIISVNQYAMLFDDPRCLKLDAINLDYVDINSYEEFESLIMKSAELKEKRYDDYNKAHHNRELDFDRSCEDEDEDDLN